jgi:DNA repair protein RecN (Recombination protein N)
VSYALKEGEEPLVQQLRQLQATLQGVATFHGQLPDLVQRLSSAGIELQDIADELEHISDHAQFDAERITFINDRLAAGYRLFKKHGVQSTAELLTIREDLQRRLDHTLNLEEETGRLTAARDASLRKLQQLADAVSAAREKALPPFEKKVNAMLVQVGMPNARLKVSMQRGDLREEGQDVIEFLFDANRTGNFQPVRKVASGGELSRLMLCIKSLVAGSIALPTLIFDEIDTGISGEAARQAGVILKELAQRHQVICITHQPQIAGKADAHYFVYKESRKEKVYTNIRLLEKEERVHAIARMLSGERPSEAALANARELISG